MTQGITRYIFTDSTCSEIQATEKYYLNKCRILSLGGQLYSVQIMECNATRWNINVYLSNQNCSGTPDTTQQGSANVCFLGAVNLYEKIECIDLINSAHSFSNQMWPNIFMLFSMLLCQLLYI